MHWRLLWMVWLRLGSSRLHPLCNNWNWLIMRFRCFNKCKVRAAVPRRKTLSSSRLKRWLTDSWTKSLTLRRPSWSRMDLVNNQWSSSHQLNKLIQICPCKASPPDKVCHSNYSNQGDSTNSLWWDSRPWAAVRCSRVDLPFQGLAWEGRRWVRLYPWVCSKYRKLRNNHRCRVVEENSHHLSSCQMVHRGAWCRNLLWKTQSAWSGSSQPNSNAVSFQHRTQTSSDWISKTRSSWQYSALTL